MRYVVAGQKLGPAILFFGCRHRLQDYIYKDELATFRESGALDTLFVAFSRDGAQKDYVQVCPALHSGTHAHIHACEGLLET